MEININTYTGRILCRGLMFVLLLSGSFFNAIAQPVRNGISINENRAYLSLHRSIMDIELQGIADHFELQELPLKDWLSGKGLGDAAKYGWKLEKIDDDWVVFSKSLEEIGDISKLENKILIASQLHSGSELYPAGVFRKEFGYNKLRQSNAVVINGQSVTFFMAGYTNAAEVKLAGSFTQWENKPVTMKQTGDGWQVTINLTPGKYFYKMIVDGKWMVHKENLLQENDGKGHMNSVLYVYNQKFVLNGYQQASRVFVAGSFNGWATRGAAMLKTRGGWELPVYLPEGTHTYRFKVDEQWMEDPGAASKLKNEFGEYNSVVMIGKPYFFRLDGFDNAKRVVLVGSFNDWRDYELELERARGGWEIPYIIGAGNHEYYYLVDGQRIGRIPEGGKIGKAKEPLNFNVVISPNYTFSLKNYKSASSVYLSGSFNNWSETGFPMNNENGEWKLKMNLPPGKQTYKFIVDGKWILDPGNILWEQNEHGTKNSVLWIDGR